MNVVSSIKGNHTNGIGWYYAGSEARYSVNSSTSSTRLLSFDHWVGDIPDAQVIAASGSLIMDNPKKIAAMWKPAYGIIGTIIAIVSGVVSGW